MKNMVPFIRYHRRKGYVYYTIIIKIIQGAESMDKFLRNNEQLMKIGYDLEKFWLEKLQEELKELQDEVEAVLKEKKTYNKYTNCESFQKFKLELADVVTCIANLSEIQLIDEFEIQAIGDDKQDIAYNQNLKK